MLKDPPPIKIVLVGNSESGKTCVIKSYLNDSYHNEHIETVLDNYKCTVTVGSVEYKVTIWDTAGNVEQYNLLRNLIYAQCDIFLICFAVNDRFQYESAIEHWKKEIERSPVSDVPIIFIGTKSDLRTDVHHDNAIDAPTISQEELTNLAKNNQYLECSALTQQGLKEVFDFAIAKVLINRTQQILAGKKKKKCSIF